MEKKITRRNFLKTIGVAAGLALYSPKDLFAESKDKDVGSRVQLIARGNSQYGVYPNELYFETEINCKKRNVVLSDGTSYSESKENPFDDYPDKLMYSENGRNLGYAGEECLLKKGFADKYRTTLESHLDKYVDQFKGLVKSKKVDILDWQNIPTKGNGHVSAGIDNIQVSVTGDDGTNYFASTLDGNGRETTFFVVKEKDGFKPVVIMNNPESEIIRGKISGLVEYVLNNK